MRFQHRQATLGGLGQPSIARGPDRTHGVESHKPAHCRFRAQAGAPDRATTHCRSGRTSEARQRREDAAALRGRESRRGPTSDACGSAARDTSPTACSPPQPLTRRPPARRLDRRHRREAPSRLFSPTDGQPRDLPFDRVHEVAKGRGAGCGSPTNSLQDGPCSLTAERTRRPALTRQAHNQPAPHEERSASNATKHFWGASAQVNPRTKRSLRGPSVARGDAQSPDDGRADR